jgi:lipopolysaccharide export system protein LptA
MSSRSSAHALLLLALLCTESTAADITANKMAIVNTEQGRVTVFEDGVSIVDGETRISASRAEFHDAENRAVISGGVNITMPGSQAVADSAEYFPGAGKTYLYRNVTVSREGLVISGQSLEMDNTLDQVLAETEVHVTDAGRGIEIWGGAGTFDLSSQDGTIYGSPRLVLKRASAMTVTGDEMQVHPGRHRARTLGHVRAVTSDATLTCDTLDYFIDEDSARAMGKPVLVQGENTVTGEMMMFHLAEGDLKRISVAGSPRLVQKEGELKGREVEIRFDKGKLAAIEVVGDSLNQPELKQERNQARGDRIAFAFADGEVQEISMTGKTRGSYLTEDSDRVEVVGRESSVRFRAGRPVLMTVAGVTDGKLFHRIGAKKP